MSLESMRRWWLVLGLALGVPALGCDDGRDLIEDLVPFPDSGRILAADSSTPDASVSVDASRSDASVTNDASTTPDAARDSGGDPMDSSMMDSSMMDATSMDGSDGDAMQPDASTTCPTDCTGVMIGSTMVRPCCSGGGDAGPASCGLNPDDLKLASPTSPFTSCVPKEVAQASASSYCGEIWDQVETTKKDNGGLDLKVGTSEVVYEGCCLPSGECGALMGAPRGASAPDAGTDAGADGGADGGVASGVDLHLGCVAYTRVRAALSLPDGGTPAAPTNQPFCNPTNGGAVTEGTVPGVPKFVCGCGANTQPESGVVPVCLANFPKEVCGRDEPDAATLATIPEYMCGCSDSATLAAGAVPCLKNVAPTVCGTKAIANNSAELNSLPEYFCGCGPNAADPGGVVACLSRVETNICGKLNITTRNAIATVSEFLCGCGNGKVYDAEQVRCLSNVDAALCGGKDITAANDPTLTKVPEFLCGCGDTVPYNQQPLPCLPNVVKPVCGALDITATQPELGKLPVFICGCGNGNLFDTEPYQCLSNVAPDVCGGVAVANGNSPWLASIPTYRCGCTGASFQQVGCLANTQSNICGRQPVTVGSNANGACLVGIAEYVKGCGLGTNPTAQTATCLRNIQASPGCVDTAVDTKGTEVTTDDCLKGVPGSQRGCGNTVGTSTNGCLPWAHDFWGCEPVGGSIPNVPEYICGCGEGVAQPAPPAYPCLSNVPLTVCGAVPVTRSLDVVGLPNTICGCGDGVLTGANCVRNVPPGVCGATPTCVAAQGPYFCSNANFRCQDNYGTNASGARGDGIDDTCP